MGGASLAMGLASGVVDRPSMMGGGFWVGQVTGLPPTVEGRVGGGSNALGRMLTSRFWVHLKAGGDFLESYFSRDGDERLAEVGVNWG